MAEKRETKKQREERVAKQNADAQAQHDAQQAEEQARLEREAAMRARAQQMGFGGIPGLPDPNMGQAFQNLFAGMGQQALNEDYAYPSFYIDGMPGYKPGMTIRAHLAGQLAPAVYEKEILAAMAQNREVDPTRVADEAVQIADALIERLRR